MRGGIGPVVLGDGVGFPPPERADESGLLAIGGDLAPGRLLEAYRNGIFPWPAGEGLPLLWWSPDPRFVLYPENLHVPRRLERTLRSGRFEVTFDTAFEEVIRACAESERREDEGTWITADMIDAYVRLHRLGYAHSTECRRDGELVGGVYGVELGRAFCGESMYYRETDASKVAFVTLVRRLAGRGCVLIDCQVETDHVARFGARPVPRALFLAQWGAALGGPAGAARIG